MPTSSWDFTKSPIAIFFPWYINASTFWQNSILLSNSQVLILIGLPDLSPGSHPLDNF